MWKKWSSLVIIVELNKIETCIYLLQPSTCDMCVYLQVMPQLLNSLRVDSTGASIDWGTLAVYTCSDSCNHDDQYLPELIWKQDFSSDQHMQSKHS